MEWIIGGVVLWWIGRKIETNPSAIKRKVALSGTDAPVDEYTRDDFQESLTRAGINDAYTRQDLLDMGLVLGDPDRYQGLSDDYHPEALDKYGMRGLDPLPPTVVVPAFHYVLS